MIESKWVCSYLYSMYGWLTKAKIDLLSAYKARYLCNEREMSLEIGCFSMIISTKKIRLRISGIEFGNSE